jgi:hypothetical protein
MENIFKNDAFKLGYESAKCLSEREDKLLGELAGDEEYDEIGENGEHVCNVDWEESAGHIDGTDGTCLACGKTDLL